MSQGNHLLLNTSHAFIAVGCFFLYIYHVRSIFETRNNFVHLSNLEREALLRKEDALYYSFYKTIVEDLEFSRGYEKLLNITSIEYPNSVNVVQRFHVLPEIVIGYLYHTFRSVSRRLNTSILSCWRTGNGDSLSESFVTCEGIGEPFYFYLHFVWMFGGFTVFIIYIYASFLSETLFGGIYAVISYVIFHKNVSKIYDRPTARENFAFPLIFLQMFYICICIDKASRKHKSDCHNFNPFMIIKLTALTTASLLCWQFSSVIYATQILIMINPWSLEIVSSRFSLEYSITQFLSNIVAYYLTYENKKYFFAWQNGPAIALFFISLVRVYKSKSRSDNLMKSILLGILLAISSQATIIDFLEKSGYANSTDNPFLVYRDLVMQWTLRRCTNFTTCLLACNSEYAKVNLNDVWEFIKILFVKPYCLYGVVLLAKFLRKWRLQIPKSENTDFVERAKKYVLEDFVEENRISMKEMSNERTEKSLKESLLLLEQCDYEFRKYKEKRNLMKRNVIDEHTSFLNEIECLNKQIKERKDGKHEKLVLDNVQNERSSEHNDNVPPNKYTFKKQDKANPCSDSATQNATKKYVAHLSPKSDEVFSYHYMYSLVQLVVFALIGLSIKKTFFLCYTQGCVLAPTLYSKLRRGKQSNLFLSISLAVFLTSIVNPGVVNVYEEYLPSKAHSDELENMLEWINDNTENNAVFGGPVDIIGTVYLTTKRPVVNHAHLDMHEIGNECDILTIWDEIQPAYKKYPQFCCELASKIVPSFLKVFSSKHYGIYKMISQSVQLIIKRNKMSEEYV